MESKNFAIGILSTTAVILFVGLLVIHTRPAPALAAGMTESAGKYVLTVGAIQTRDEELLFVTNSNAMKMNVYRFNVGTSKIERVDQIDLEAMRAGTGSAPPSKKGSRSRRRP